MTQFKIVADSSKKTLAALLLYILVVYTKGLYFFSLDGVWFWIFDIICFVVVPIVLIGYTTAFKGFDQGFHVESQYTNKSYLKRMLQIMIYSILSLILVIIVHAIGIRVGLSVQKANPRALGIVFSYASKIPVDFNLKLIAITYLALTAGIVEEIFFRGFAKIVVEKYITKNPAFYVIISALIFSGAHWAGGLANMVNSFFLGLLFAMLYLWIKDLRPLMIAHAMFDWSVFRWL